MASLPAALSSPLGALPPLSTGRAWLDYMRHLKADYPYLFSLAIRTNPFRLDASPVIRQG
jgi:hypothetical protein